MAEPIDIKALQEKLNTLSTLEGKKELLTVNGQEDEPTKKAWLEFKKAHHTDGSLSVGYLTDPKDKGGLGFTKDQLKALGVDEKALDPKTAKESSYKRNNPPEALVKEVQKQLKQPETGKLDDATKAAVKAHKNEKWTDARITADQVKTLVTVIEDKQKTVQQDKTAPAPDQQQQQTPPATPAAPAAGEGQGTGQSKQDGGFFDFLGNNLGGIGGLVLGAMLGSALMPGMGILGMLIGALLLGAAGSFMMDGKEGVTGQMTGGGKTPQRGPTGDTMVKDGLINGKLLEQELESKPLAKVSVQARDKEREGGTRLYREDGSTVNYYIDKDKNITAVSFTKDGREGEAITDVKGLALKKGPDGQYVIPDYHDNRVMNLQEKADEKWQNSDPAKLAKTEELGKNAQAQNPAQKLEVDKAAVPPEGKATTPPGKTAAPAETGKGK